MLATVGEVGRREAWTQVVDSEVLERLVEIGILEGTDVDSTVANCGVHRSGN